MEILFTIHRTTRDGPPAHFDCPQCKEPAANPESFEFVEQLRLFYFIPITRMTRNTYVRCGKCGGKWLVKSTLEELEHLSPQEIASQLTRTTFLANAILLLGLLGFWAPVIGPILCLIALLMHVRQPGWKRIASAIGLAVGLTVTAYVMWVIP